MRRIEAADMASAILKDASSIVEVGDLVNFIYQPSPASPPLST